MSGVQAQPAGFDAAARRYDADVDGNRVFAHMRTRIFEQLLAAFAPSSTLLEIGSGTGTEAARLAAERGCRVVLVDTSAKLLERAAQKVSAASATGLLGAHLLPARAIGSLAAAYGQGSFDGAFSSLGPLNCEERLTPVAEGLAELVRPGGALVLSLMNRWYPMEFAWFALRGRWREATSRWGGSVAAAAYPNGPKDIATWYYTRRDVERAFGAGFRIEHAEALPLLWPPPYLEFVLERLEWVFRALEPIERRISRGLVLRDLGDHVLLRLRRR